MMPCCPLAPSRPERRSVTDPATTRPPRTPSVAAAPRRIKNRAPGRALALALALLVVFTALSGCARVRAALAVQPDDTVNGEIVVATPETGPDDPGPAISVPEEIADDVDVSAYRQEGYTGSLLRFSGLTFDQLSRLSAAAGPAGERVQFSLRRAGNRLLVTGKADLTTVPVDKADFQLKITTSGEVLETNGDADAGTASWTFDAGKVGDVTAVIAVRRPERPVRDELDAAHGDTRHPRLRRGGAAGPPHAQPPGPPAPLTRPRATVTDRRSARERRRGGQPQAVHQLGRRRRAVQRVEVQPPHPFGQQPGTQLRGDVQARRAERHRVVRERLQPLQHRARHRRPRQLGPAPQSAHTEHGHDPRQQRHVAAQGREPVAQPQEVLGFQEQLGDREVGARAGSWRAAGRCRRPCRASAGDRTGTRPPRRRSRRACARSRTSSSA